MSSTRYDDDILLWSERQADLLRRHAAGERLNEVVDWDNVIEEIESVGRSELKSCRSLLRRAISHLLKVAADDEARDAPHWKSEILAFLADAQDAFSPSMRQRLDLGQIYRQARDEVSPLGITGPAICPLTLDDLLCPQPDLASLLAKIHGP